MAPFLVAQPFAGQLRTQHLLYTGPVPNPREIPQGRTAEVTTLWGDVAVSREEERAMINAR